MKITFLRSLIHIALILSGLLAGCGPRSGPEGTQSIGTVSRVSDIVRQNQVQVAGTNPLQENDTIGLSSGGEGLLDFGGQLLLRLFNDSQVGGIQAEAGPGASLLARLRLEFGGFTGQLAQPGSQVAFETPNGAVVNVAGTDFFVVYNRDSRQTYCGNWVGQMWVEAGGSGRLPVPQGMIYRVEPGQQPAPWAQIPWTMDEFAQLARSSSSPLAPIQLAAQLVRPTAAPDSTPPSIEIVSVEPARIVAGGECPGATGTTQVIVRIFDEGGLRTATAAWVYNGVQDAAALQAIDDQTFGIVLGPFDPPGELIVVIQAQDNAGNIGQSARMAVPVEFCIG